MIQEFKAFALRGNVVDMAVGIVIGAAFSTIVTSLVGDIIMPIIGVATGGLNFSGLAYKVGGATIAYGKFIQASFSFLIVSFALFALIKAMNAMKKKEEESSVKSVAPAPDVVLLTEIRDILKKS